VRLPPSPGSHTTPSLPLVFWLSSNAEPMFGSPELPVLSKRRTFGSQRNENWKAFTSVKPLTVTETVTWAAGATVELPAEKPAAPAHLLRTGLLCGFQVGLMSRETVRRV